MFHPDAKTAHTRSTTRSRRTPKPWGVLALLLAILWPPAAIEATTAPKPGHEFPQSFVEFRAANPELFNTQRGLKGWVERARLERQLFFQSGDPAKRLAEGDLQKMTVSGTVQVPVVPVLFTPLTAPAPPTAAALDAILFSGPNPTGTVTQYYDEVSYGLLNLTGTVFPYTTLPQSDTFYEDGNNGFPGGGGLAVGGLMQDALNLLDGTVNFGQFDNDGPDNVPNSGDDDGFVDLISFLHPERGGECGTTNIWAHRWTYTGWFGAPYATNDAAAGGGTIQIDDYNIQAALNCADQPMEIGTFAHETGHIFGIPDLYDTDGSSNGAGHWSLMAAGNWNTQQSPAHMSAWEKAELGWLIPTLLTAPVNNITLPEVENNPTAYQVVVGNGEYFLIENRQAVGFDQNLHTCGLAIWHVDQATVEAQTPLNRVNRRENCGIHVQVAGQHYGLALEQADGQCDLEADLNRGDDGDLYPGSSGSTSFTTATFPDSDSYVSGPTLVEVTNISACGANMTADVDAVPIPPTTGPVDVVFLIDNTGSYANDWPNIQAQMPGIVAKLQNNFADIRYGLAMFRDFPFTPFGGASDFAYQEELPLTTNSTAFSNAIANLQSPGGGYDGPESQYEAVHQLLTGAGRDLFGDGVNGNQTGEITPSSIGWDPARHRVIYLMTDASFHDSDTESYPTGTSTVPAPILEAEGRNSVRGQVAALMGSGVGMTLFTLVAEHPGAFVTEGQDGLTADVSVSEMVEQASELTDLTGGGVMFVGSDSSELTAAMEVSIEVLNKKTLLPRDMVDWGTHITLPYGKPDPRSDFEVTRDGAAITLTGNSWRRTVRTYDITPGTVLEFEFVSTSPGKLHAIGFDDNQKPDDKPRFFQFFGSGDWPGNGAVRDFDQKYTGSGKLEKFVIKVGRYYTGEKMSLVIVSSGDKRANGTFRNVRLVEQEP